VRDRVVVALARLLTRAFFRSVEVEGPPPPDGPVVLAASHLYGFVDPVVLVARMGRFPRFLAKATLWSVPPAAVALRLVGAIPVHRRQDGAVAGANDGTFTSAIEALRAGEKVAIFPEGTTHDEPTLRPLRTGAARIALEAAAAGVEGVQVVPVGVTYEDKVEVRGRALVSYGPPIPVAAPEGDERAAVRALTDRLQHDLQALTPHFATTEEALALQAAATITLTVDGEAPLLADVQGRARRLALLDDDRRAALVDLVARYKMLLGFVDLDDADVARRDVVSVLVRRLVVLAVLGVVLAPFAVAGLFANLAPAVLVLVAGLTVRAPVSKGTVRLLVALVTFPLMWGIWAWQDSGTGAVSDLARSVTYPVAAVVGPDPADRSSALADVLAVLVAPVLGGLALVLLGRIRDLIAGMVRWRTLIDRRGQLDEVRSRRAEVVDAAQRALR
jgi:glycerol-3-phosphate O-acyltransferase/dihydroxyacetone phosphate acyltransferase